MSDDDYYANEYGAEGDGTEYDPYNDPYANEGGGGGGDSNTYEDLYNNATSKSIFI